VKARQYTGARREGDIGPPPEYWAILWGLESASVRVPALAAVWRGADLSTLTSIQRDTFEAMRVLTNKAMRPVALSPMQ
jgi:hypothetical protein